MALSILLERKNPPTIGALALDAALSENHSFESEVSQFPVEDGSIITDHIVNKPDSVTINGLVTDSPIDLAVLFSSLGSVRSQAAFELLEELHRTREPVKIVTNLKVYESMAMRSLSIPKNAKVGSALEFTATFVQIRIVTSETVLTEDLAVPTKDLSSSTRDAGNQNTSAATEAEAEGGSFLFNAFFGG
jgi:hypothetical protein